MKLKPQAPVFILFHFGMLYYFISFMPFCTHLETLLYDKVLQFCDKS